MNDPTNMNGVLAELRVTDRDFVTDWTLRNLEGKWLIEATTPTIVSAKCERSLGAAVRHAFDYHCALDPPE